MHLIKFQITSEQANTIFNALKNPITSGFDNPKNNNLNNITNMVNNIIQNITGKTSIIEGHENDCHSTADGILELWFACCRSQPGHNKIIILMVNMNLLLKKK